MTGGRLKRVVDHVGDDTFCLTYGDGVSDVNVDELIKFHRNENTLATLTAVQPPGRFGGFTLGHNDSRVQRSGRSRAATAAGSTAASSSSSPRSSTTSKATTTIWEREPLERLARDGQLPPTATTDSGTRWTRCATRHVLEDMWNAGKAPWKVWDGRLAA